MSPMARACQRGQLHVCKWLHDHGAADDIAKLNHAGTTPFHYACLNGHLSICKWLVFNGALNKPIEAAADDGPGGSIQDPGHIDPAVVLRDTRTGLTGGHRPTLLAWAKRVVATHHTFSHVVLRASVLLPASQLQASSEDRCHLPRLPHDELERVASFLGVETGRRLRNAREFAEVLAVMLERRASVRRT